MHTETFRGLKKLVKGCTVLAHYDESKTLLLSCDASPYGVEVVLVKGDDRKHGAPCFLPSVCLSCLWDLPKKITST